MQFQADILGVPVVRPKVTETTALGAAYLAGLAVGFWQDPDEIAAQWQVDRRFEPQMDAAERQLRIEQLAPGRGAGPPLGRPPKPEAGIVSHALLNLTVSRRTNMPVQCCDPSACGTAASAP